MRHMESSSTAETAHWSLKLMHTSKNDAHKEGMTQVRRRHPID